MKEFTQGESMVQIELPIDSPLKEFQQGLYRQFEALLSDPTAQAEPDLIGTEVADLTASIRHLDLLQLNTIEKQIVEELEEMLQECLPLAHLISEQYRQILFSEADPDKDDELGTFLSRLFDLAKRAGRYYDLEKVAKHTSVLAKRYFEGIKKILSATIAERENLLIQKAQLTLPIGNYLISQDIAQKILAIDEYGYKPKSEFGGTHVVVCLHGAFYKPNPDRDYIEPTNEHAVVAFLQLMTNREGSAATTDVIKLRRVIVHRPLELFEVSNDKHHEMAYLAMQDYLQDGKTVAAFMNEQPEKAKQLRLKKDYHARVAQVGLKANGILLHDLLLIQFVLTYFTQGLSEKITVKLFRKFKKIKPVQPPKNINELFDDYVSVMGTIEDQDRIKAFQIKTFNRGKLENEFQLLVQKYGHESAEWALEVLKQFPQLGKDQAFYDVFSWHRAFKKLNEVLPNIPTKNAVRWGVNCLDLIDDESFSYHFIAALLINPEDGKPDNYFAELEYDNNVVTKIRICAIDNDKSFANPIIEVKWHNQPTQHFVGIKCILFLLSGLMRKEISKNAIRKLVEKNCIAIILDWLLVLGHREQQYRRWIEQGILDSNDVFFDDEKSLDVPFKFSPVYFADMMKRFKEMISFINQPKIISHNELLKFIFPMVADYYKKVSAQLPANPMAALRAIYTDGAYSIEQQLQVNQFEAISGLERNTTIDRLAKQLLPTNLNSPVFADVFDKMNHLLPVGLEMPERVIFPLVKQAIIEGKAGIVRQLLVPKHRELFSRSSETLFHVLAKHYDNDHVSDVSLRYIVKKIFKFQQSSLNQADENQVKAIFLLMDGMVRAPERALMIIKEGLKYGLDLSVEQPNSEGKLENLLSRAIRLIAEKPQKTEILLVLIQAGVTVGKYIGVLLQFFNELNKLNLSPAVLAKLNDAHQQLVANDREYAWFLTVTAFKQSPLQEKQLKHYAVIYKAVAGPFFNLVDSITHKILNNKHKIIHNTEHEEKFGRHFVCRMDVRNYSMYLKFYPEMPGIEASVGSFCRILFGWGTPEVSLIRLQFNEDRVGIPVICSQTIAGQNLQQVFNQQNDDEVKNLLDTLDLKEFSELFLMVLLRNEEDGKPDNYVLQHYTTIDGQQKHRLIAVDNDHAWVHPIKIINENGNIKRILQIKSIVFCLDTMLSPLHPSVIERFLKRPIKEVLESWIDQLEIFEQRTNGLFTLKERKKLYQGKEHDPVVLGLPFSRLTIANLYDKMQRIQHILTKDPKITALELLKKIMPMVGEYYQMAFDKADSPKERFHCLAKDLYANSNSEEYQTVSTALRLVETQQLSKSQLIGEEKNQTPDQMRAELAAIQKEHQKLEGVYQLLLANNVFALSTLLLDKSKQKVINRLDFANFTESQEKAIFKHIIDTKIAFTKIRIVNAKSLTDKQLKAILKNSPDLEEIYLENITSPKLTGDSFSSLGKFCPGIKSVVLKGITGLIKLEREISFGSKSHSPFIRLPALRRLIIENCQALRQMKLSSSNITYLVIQGSPNIDYLDLLKCLEINPSLTYFFLDSTRIPPIPLAYYCAKYRQWHDEQLAVLLQIGGLIQQGTLRLDGLPLHSDDLPKILRVLPKMIERVNIANVPNQLACFAQLFLFSQFNQVVLENSIAVAENNVQDGPAIELKHEKMISTVQINQSGIYSLTRLSDFQFARIPAVSDARGVFIDWFEDLENPINVAAADINKAIATKRMNDKQFIVADKTQVCLLDQTGSLIISKDFKNIDCVEVLFQDFIAVSRKHVVLISSMFSKTLCEKRFENVVSINGRVTKIPITRLKFQPPATLWVGCINGVLREINLEDNELKKGCLIYETNGSNKSPELISINDIVVFLDHQLGLASEGHLDIKIFNPRISKMISLSGHTAGVRTLEIIRDNYLLSGSNDKTIRLWDIYRQTCLKVYERHISPLSSIIKLNNDYIITGDSPNIFDILEQVGASLNKYQLNVWRILDFKKNRDYAKDAQLNYWHKWYDIFTFVAGNNFLILQFKAEMEWAVIEERLNELFYLKELFKDNFKNFNMQKLIGLRQIIVINDPMDNWALATMLSGLHPLSVKLNLTHMPSYEQIKQFTALTEWSELLIQLLHTEAASFEYFLQTTDGFSEETTSIDMRILYAMAPHVIYYSYHDNVSIRLSEETTISKEVFDYWLKQINLILLAFNIVLEESALPGEWRFTQPGNPTRRLFEPLFQAIVPRKMLTAEFMDQTSYKKQKKLTFFGSIAPAEQNLVEISKLETNKDFESMRGFVS